MPAYLIAIISIVSLAIYICAGIVCGRICVEIIRGKNEDMNEVLWFWAGFLFTAVAVFMTFAVKDKKGDK